MTLGQRLAQQRKIKNLTQQQLGEILSISPQAISKWENDQAEPDISTLLKLSEIFGVPVDALITDKEQQVPPKNEEQPEGEQASQEKSAPRATRRFSCFLKKHRKKLILTAALLLVLTSAFVVLKLNVLTPATYFNANRITTEMTTKDVLDMLGDPHDTTTMIFDGEKYVEDNSGFLSGFYEGLGGDVADLKQRKIYYYYSSNYVKFVEEFDRLLWDYDASKEQTLLEKAEKMTFKQLVITFDENDKVTSVLFSKTTQDAELYDALKDAELTRCTSPVVYQSSLTEGRLVENEVTLYFEGFGLYRSVYSSEEKISLAYSNANILVIHDDDGNILQRFACPFGNFEVPLEILETQ